jgi:lipopolysaccharide export system permease protein
MGLLQRHIFKSVLFASTVAVGLFAFVLMVGNAVKDLLGYVVAGQLRLEMFAELVLLLLPFVVAYALPIGVLTGVLLVLGRMSAEHEITAIRAAGLSLPWVARPVLLLAALGVLVGAAINFQFMPWARVVYHTELANAVRANPLSFIVPRTFVREFPGRVLYVGEKNGTTVKDFWMWELDAQGRVKNFVRAAAGSVDFDEATDELALNLRDVRIETMNPNTPEEFAPPQAFGHFGSFPTRLALRRLFGPVMVHRKLQWYTFPELLAEWRRLETPAAAPDGPAQALQRMKVQMVIQDKITTAFAVFTLALIGVPLGIKVSRRETSANLGVALALAMGYYFLTVVIGWLEDRPELRPDLLMWLPNLIFLGVGLWLFWRMDRAGAE